jgi:hypothetical protein
VVATRWERHSLSCRERQEYRAKRSDQIYVSP